MKPRLTLADLSPRMQRRAVKIANHIRKAWRVNKIQALDEAINTDLVILLSLSLSE